MDSKNLAICWWPTLLQFDFVDMNDFETARPHLMNFIQILIDCHVELFEKPSQGHHSIHHQKQGSYSLDSAGNFGSLSHSHDELAQL